MSSKGLESLERIVMPDELFIEECKRLNIDNHSDYETIKKELQRLESIDNANHSEAINCLHTVAFNTQFIAGMNFGNELRTIEQSLLKSQEQEKENKLLKEIIRILFDRGCPLHLYMDDKLGLTIEVDDECSIMQLGEFKGVDLGKKLKEVLEDE